MRVTATTEAPADDRRRHDRRRASSTARASRTTSTGGALQALLDSGEASGRFKHLAVDARRGQALDRSSAWATARTSTPSARGSPRRPCTGAHASSARSALCWELPHHARRRRRSAGSSRARVLRGLPLRPRTERRRRRARRRRGADRLRPRRPCAPRWRGRRSSPRRSNAARDLQNAPANDMTPTALGRRARGRSPGVDGRRVEGRDEIAAPRDGRVRRRRPGPDEEPALITLRYEPAGRDAARCSASSARRVTFDTGGISIKPAGEDGGR